MVASRYGGSKEKETSVNRIQLHIYFKANSCDIKLFKLFQIFCLQQKDVICYTLQMHELIPLFYLKKYKSLLTDCDASSVNTEDHII